MSVHTKIDEVSFKSEETCLGRNINTMKKLQFKVSIDAPVTRAYDSMPGIAPLLVFE
jgi:hypothetical protein